MKAQAGRKTRLGALAKLTEDVDGRRRLRHRPPLIVRFTDEELESELHRVQAFFARYLESLSPDRRHLLSNYLVTDLARKVVGVGSVGTRCLVALLESGDGEALFLQLKEAGPSVLEQFAEDLAPGHNGRRVVEGQRILQSAPDVFLGWSHYETEAGTTDFYVRQLWDGKASAIVDEMGPEGVGPLLDALRCTCSPAPTPAPVTPTRSADTSVTTTSSIARSPPSRWTTPDATRTTTPRSSPPSNPATSQRSTTSEPPRIVDRIGPRCASEHTAS